MFFIGLDIGGTKTEVIAITLKLEELYRERFLNQCNQEENIEKILKHIFIIEKQFGKEYSIGIGIRGWIQNSIKSIKTSIKWVKNNFISTLEKKLNKNISIENDTKCFAISESKFGAGENFKDALYLILGTGTAVGIVLNNQLYSGVENLSGEFGANIFPYIEDKIDILKYFKKSEKYLTIEDVISGPAFETFYKNKNNLKTPISSKEIMERYRKKEKNSIFVYKNYIELLAIALSQISNLLMPEIIVIGGGLSNIEELYEDLYKELKKYSLLGNSPKIAKAKFGDSSGVIGAAFLNKVE